jgi:hypothetical protein
MIQEAYDKAEMKKTQVFECSNTIGAAAKVNFD